ncbi:MAG: cupin domain-containing protein [Nitrospinota bacterium]
MGKKRIVSIDEAVTGKLPSPGGGGTFKILIDEETTGARHFSLLVNEMAPGHMSKEHSHKVEHCWYILSGQGKMHMEGEVHDIKAGDAVFAPIDVPHKVECTSEEPLRYVLVYAPPGPEKELKSKSGFAAES